MADPKKPAPDPATSEPIPPEEMTYPTPELDPKTGAPLDTRFQNDASQEATVQPSPKSEAEPPPQEQDGEEEEDEDEDDDKASKGKEKPKRRR